MPDRPAPYLFPPAQLNAAQAAHYVGAPTEATFWRWVAEGTMPAGAKAGKFRLWRRADLDAAIDRLHDLPDPAPMRGGGEVAGYDAEKVRAARRAAARG